MCPIMDKFMIILCVVSVCYGGLINERLLFEIEGEVTEDGKLWALLVAGSSGWYNYRHQADVCHAYQIMHAHGIPDEQIVVMMYDDIANNEENPVKGNIINQPHGPNVYEGVLKDYTKDDVTPEVFLNVLQGKSENLKGVGSSKVINSGPNDHIFVNFVDHGAPGLVAFPDSELTATQLNKALQDMYDEQKFAQMVIYIEACESGSMFKTLLPKNINVFATTAANDSESSYACYYDTKRKTYLGDVYSVNWMQDSDKENLNVETLQKQFEITKEETNTSHVKEFGDITMANEPVGDFQGEGSAKTGRLDAPHPTLDAVRSEDVPMAILKRKLMATNSEKERKSVMLQLEEMALARGKVHETIKHIVALSTDSHRDLTRILSSRHTLYSYDCYEEVYYKLKSTCQSLNLPNNDYALRYLYAFVNMCEERIPTETITEAIEKICFIEGI